MNHAAGARFRLLSLLLSYPSDEIVDGRDEIASAAAGLPPGRARDAIGRFLDYFVATPPLALQQGYVETFDLQKRSSLYLTFFIHGDTRKRGQELLRLKRLYRAAGFILEGAELPDYLPLLLEFAALDPEHGEWVLREHRAGLELLQTHLREQRSPYAELLEAVRAGLPALGRAQLAELRRVAASGPPREEVGLEPFAPPEVMPGIGARP
jgi:nitrate reductase molybdenum cofactor assembly chaperone NarJ/NarW